MTQQIRGFSLIEIIFSLTLMSVLAMTALPSLAKLIQSSATASVGNRLLAELNRARLAAVVRHAQVSLCPEAAGQTCLDKKDWSKGVISFIDTDQDRQRDANEEVISTFPESDLDKLLLQTSDGRTIISFNPDGRTAGTNVTFRICAADLNNLRRVIINISGRSRIDGADPSYNCVVV